jgi:hypothetical protein
MGNGLKDATTTHVAFAITNENNPNSLGGNHKQSMPQRPNELKPSYHWIYINFFFLFARFLYFLSLLFWAFLLHFHFLKLYTLAEMATKMKELCEPHLLHLFKHRPTKCYHLRYLHIQGCRIYTHHNI